MRRRSAIRKLALGGVVLGLSVAPPIAAASPSKSSSGGATVKHRPAPSSQVAMTPPMGWDSWDAFGCGVNERDVEATANWLVRSGLRDAGYRYVIIDDCWYAPTRSASGSLRANTSKFPTGMRWLGSYLHARGLLFGIYASAAQNTCAQENGIYPGATGSLGHEQQDANTFASWGVDYLKYDWCTPNGSLHDQVVELTKMRNALRATHRRIVYSINPNSFHTLTGGAYNWSRIANLVRIAPDLAPVWNMGPLWYWYSGIVNAIGFDAPLWRRAGPGHWNDPDALIMGLQPASYAYAVGSPALAAFIGSPDISAYGIPSLDEMRANFAMWSMLAAPLILGDDIRGLTPTMRRVLLNRQLIAVDQDPLGRQGYAVRRSEKVWLKPLSNHQYAVALFNHSPKRVRLFTTPHQLGLPPASKYTVLNLWTGKTWSTPGPLWALVPGHGVVVFRVTPVYAAPSHHPAKKHHARDFRRSAKRHHSA
jgi:alpha-galactosidase